ncbi:hypothetical protein PROFUN_06604 [Planoprotostelium fungivorum]|uniref:Uncharacterized protein n=1 Tax=Planoprotostelium fungivorum TaxID=1890364 RepID=A0A2P6MS01_9EUKA|nr:hypothetical protein PROFUN_06604 [Planoprotostelium fungivorum]
MHSLKRNSLAFFDLKSFFINRDSLNCLVLKLKQQQLGRHHNEHQYGDTGDRRALSLSPSKNILVESSLLLSVQAGPLLGVFCISPCNAGYVACCASLGVTAAFTLGAGVPVAVATCSVAQGACMTACAVAPTP